MSDWKPAAYFDNASAIQIKHGPPLDFEVNWEELRYCCKLRTDPDSDFLHVSVASHVGLAGPPTFPRFNRPMEGNLLEIFDPTIFLWPDLRIAAFIGTRDKDAVSGLVEIAKTVANRLKVNHSRIVFWGASGAAHGAVMAAIRMGSSGNVVAVNPLLELSDFASKPMAKTWTAVFGAGPFGEIVKQHPLRLSVTAALYAAAVNGQLPRLWVFQNTEDVLFHDQQFVPFCRRWGRIGIESGKIRLSPFSHPSGHGLEPPEILEKILAGDFPIKFRGEDWELRNMVSRSVGSEAPWSPDLQAALTLAKTFLPASR